MEKKRKKSSLMVSKNRIRGNIEEKARRGAASIFLKIHRLTLSAGVKRKTRQSTLAAWIP